MTSNIKLISVFIISFLLLTACAKGNKKELANEREVPTIIFETDMGNDVDDALALDMLYKYLDKGQIKLLSIMTNKNSVYSAEYLDLMNTWYGYPAIPIGIMKGGPNSEDDALNYAKAVCLLEESGKPMFDRSLSNYESLPEAHILYRKLLASQPDSSVDIVSVGFSTNLIRLLDTPADEYSPLTGVELVGKKVKLLSAMLGSFGADAVREYNVIVDIPAAKKIFEEWPTAIVVSPFEVGDAIKYPATSIEKDFAWAPHHPMVEAYKAYLPMPYDRPTWDLTSLMYVAENDNHKMSISAPGIISIDDEGYSHYQSDATGKHRYLSVDVLQAEVIKAHFVNLIKSKPLKYQNK